MSFRSIEVMTVFFISLNLASGMLVASGAAADMGLDNSVNVGGDEQVEESEAAADEIATGAPTGSTLFGMYNVLASTVSAIGTVVFGGPAMFANLGAPGWITNPMGVIVGIVYAFGIVRLLRGI